MRKLDLIKKRKLEEESNQVFESRITFDQTEQVKALKSVESAVTKLYETINDQEPLDLSVLVDQLKTLNDKLNLGEALKSLESTVIDSQVHHVSIEQFGDLLKAVKENRPLPVEIDLTKLEKAIIQVQQRVQDASLPNQAADEYTAVRRVIKVGNRLVFDDTPTGSGGRGGGGGSSNTVIQDEGGEKVTVTNGKLDVNATVNASVDTTGLATDTNQTNGSQKTQIVDSGGEAATITGGKLDVNATAELAGETLPVAGATEGVAVAIVDGSGNQITSFGGGTQYTEGDTDASVTGTAMMWEDGSDTLRAVSAVKPLPVDIQDTSLPVTQATASSLNAQVVGNVADAASDSGNPVKVGGVNKSTPPTLTDGQRGDVNLDTRENVKISIWTPNGNTAQTYGADNADGSAVSGTAGRISAMARNQVFNGTTWDRMRGDATDGTLVNLGSNNDVTVSGAVTATPEKASSATLANVSTSTSSATLLASNSARKKAVIVNDSTAILYVKFGTTASATSYSYLLQPNDTLEEVTYTGRIDGILASGTGTARTTEL